jgi:hypothetical protein
VKYLVSTRGESQWVKNLQNDPNVTLTTKSGTTKYLAHETILSERPEWRDHSMVELRHLRISDGDIASQDAVTNPAHWAILLVEGEGFVDKATGQPVDEDDIDWNTEDDPSLEPAEGGEGGGRFSPPASFRDALIWPLFVVSHQLRTGLSHGALHFVEARAFSCLSRWTR